MGLIHAWGRNGMSTSKKLAIHWVVTDPLGEVSEDYYDWQAFTTEPGDEHEFIGGRFDINKPGTWAIVIDLIMNPDNPVIVATYDGILCVVTEEVEEVYAGTISRKEFEYDGTRGDIPVQ